MISNFKYNVHLYMMFYEASFLIKIEFQCLTFKCYICLLLQAISILENLYHLNSISNILNLMYCIITFNKFSAYTYKLTTTMEPIILLLMQKLALVP